MPAQFGKEHKDDNDFGLLVDVYCELYCRVLFDVYYVH